MFGTQFSVFMTLRKLKIALGLHHITVSQLHSVHMEYHLLAKLDMTGESPG